MSDLPMYKIASGSVPSDTLQDTLRHQIENYTEGTFKGKYFLEAHSVTPQVGNHTLCYVLIFRRRPFNELT